MSTRDELAGVLIDTINKQFKDMKVAYFLDGSDTTPTDVKDFISTGSTMLDLERYPIDQMVVLWLVESQN